jgi:hypothetical protein
VGGPTWQLCNGVALRCLNAVGMSTGSFLATCRQQTVMQLAVMQPDLATIEASSQAAPAIKALKAANIAPEVRPRLHAAKLACGTEIWLVLSLSLLSTHLQREAEGAGERYMQIADSAGDEQAVICDAHTSMLIGSRPALIYQGSGEPSNRVWDPALLAFNNAAC